MPFSAFDFSKIRPAQPPPGLPTSPDQPRTGPYQTEMRTGPDQTGDSGFLKGIIPGLGLPKITGPGMATGGNMFQSPNGPDPNGPSAIRPGGGNNLQNIVKKVQNVMGTPPSPPQAMTGGNPSPLQSMAMTGGNMSAPQSNMDALGRQQVSNSMMPRKPNTKRLGMF